MRAYRFTFSRWKKNAALRFPSLVTQAETVVLRIVVKFPQSGAKAWGVMWNAQKMSDQQLKFGVLLPEPWIWRGFGSWLWPG